MTLSWQGLCRYRFLMRVETLRLAGCLEGFAAAMPMDACVSRKCARNGGLNLEFEHIPTAAAGALVELLLLG